MGYYTPFWGFNFFEGFFWIIMIALLIAAMIRVARGGSSYHRHWRYHYRNTAALDILKQRYAKGEITKDEFDRMKRDIEEE